MERPARTSNMKRAMILAAWAALAACKPEAKEEPMPVKAMAPAATLETATFALG